jgi:tetratricopeptide (TPR) repeat protein
MWRLEHIDALWWWLLIPASLLIFIWIRGKRQQNWSELGNPTRIQSLLSDMAAAYRAQRMLLWLLAIVLLVLALANLQAGAEEEKVSNKGSNVIIALDLSNSMLAKDVAPDRLERSKNFITRLTEQLGGDRVAFIVFAGRAYLQMPFTSDYGALELQLRTVSTDMMPTQGTALGEAIQLAVSMPAAMGQKEKVMILLSDGEDHDNEAISMAKKAASDGVTIYSIGVGTDKGAPIPEMYESGDLTYKRDQNGEMVLTKLNEDNLRKIAAAGNGQYFNISNERKALREIGKAIRWSGGVTGEEKIYTRYKSYFQWFLLPAILLLMLEMILYKPVSGRFTSKLMMLLPIAVWMLFGCKEAVHQHEAKAFQYYQEGKFKEAVQAYRMTMSADSLYEKKGLLHLSMCFQSLGQVDSAVYYIDSLLSRSPDTLLTHQCYYNKGNLLYQKKDYREAVKAYNKALEMIPGHYRTQFNLCLALQHLPKTPPQDQSPPDDQQDQKDPPSDQKDQKDKEQEEKDNKDKQKGDQGKEDPKNQEGKGKPQDKGQQKPPPPSKPGSQKINAADMERLFQQLSREERAVQKRIYKESGDNTYKPTVEKDW